MKTKEINWWGNDINEGSRFEVDRDRVWKGQMFDVSIIHDWVVKFFGLING